MRGDALFNRHMIDPGPTGRLGIFKTLPTVVFVAVLLLGGSAHADSVDRLTRSLKTSSDAKVRISAVLSLTSVGDPRALGPLVAALQDRDASVRAVSASAIGKIVTGGTDVRTRVAVLKKLEKTRSGDSSALVRRQALQSYKTIAEFGK